MGFPSHAPDLDVLPGFQNPPAGYGEVPFWWWTGDPLDKDRLLWQIEQLHRQGVGGMQINYAHQDTPGWPTYPAQPEIFSDAWWQIWQWTVGECRKRNMGLGLSGYTLDWPGKDNLFGRLLYGDPQLNGIELVLAQKVRLDYEDVKVQLTEERYFRPIFDWHWKRGLIYACDPGSRGQNPEEFGDYFRCVRWYTAPGDSAHLIKDKVSSSIAHLYQRPRVWVEGYHSLGWGATPATLMKATCENYLYGCTLLNLHGLYYTTHGSFWEWAPTRYRGSPRSGLIGPVRLEIQPAVRPAEQFVHDRQEPGVSRNRGRSCRLGG